MGYIILLVEDDQFLADMYMTILSREKRFSVLRATSGEEAVAIARSRQIDLMLLDIALPGIDGIETLKTIREHEKERGAESVPVLVLTNVHHLKDRDRIRQYGIVDYMVKAYYLPSEVLERVKRIVLRK